MTQRNAMPWLVALALLAVAAIYLPVRHADFVWDDLLDFRDMAWLREGTAWQHYVLKDFNGWVNYFRPLGVLLFTGEVRIFHSLPGPMHLVSLGMHLVNMCLVFIVSRRFAQRLRPDTPVGFAPLVGMTIYGFHPVLIEPVVWIGCQFELLLIMFLALGLLANMTMKDRATRAVTVATLFFLAACSKESAVVFPLLLVVFDWLLLVPPHQMRFITRAKLVMAQNWPTYVAIVLAGIAYLAFRHWALGSVFESRTVARLTAMGRIQEVCFLYLKNWQMLLWPMAGMSPIHPMSITSFNTISSESVLLDIAALLLAGFGVRQLLRSQPGFGTLVMAATLAFLPVLHIIPSDFDSSLYHERYVMTALAAICVLLPVLSPFSGFVDARSKLVKRTLIAFGSVWLLASMVNIRVTLPLWADNLKLWQWALAQYPESTDAKDNLLSAFIRAGDKHSAHSLIDQLLKDDRVCPNCMLNAAVLAIQEESPSDAQAALDRIRDSRELAVDPQMFGKYLLTTGQMLFLQGKTDDSVQVLKGAMAANPQDPEPALSLAVVKARTGHLEEARGLGLKGLALLPPDMRPGRAKEIQSAILDSSKASVHTSLAH